jgi:hypothetical protein
MSGIIHRGFGDGVLRIKKRPRWQLFEDIKSLESQLHAADESLRVADALAKAIAPYVTKHTPSLKDALAAWEKARGR